MSWCIPLTYAAAPTHFSPPVTSYQAVTAVDTAFFSFACALPESEATLSASSGLNSLSSSDNDVRGQSATSGGEDGDDETAIERVPAPADDDEAEAEAEVDENNETAAVDDGSVWEVHEGGACVFFFSLDGGNYSAVEPTAAAASATADSSSSMSSSSSSLVAQSRNTLLLTGLADGAHELR